MVYDKFFVMIFSMDGQSLFAMTNSDSDAIALFESRKSAEAAGRENLMGSANGFLVFHVYQGR